VPDQRNPYKGSPPRSWIRVRVIGVDESVREIELLADTGNPCELIVGPEIMRAFKRGDGPDVSTNFGPLEGGWLQIAVPELSLNRYVLGYSSEVVVRAAEQSHADFAGLAGLPLLRTMEYGGNADSFWLRQANVGSSSERTHGG